MSELERGDPFATTRGAVARAAYLQLFPCLRDEAQKHGYALAPHDACGCAPAPSDPCEEGFYLVAVPWTEGASSGEVLVKALCEMAGLSVRPGADGQRPEPELHPHGRLSWTLMVGGPLFLDLSIMPRLAPVIR